MKTNFQRDRHCLGVQGSPFGVYIARVDTTSRYGVGTALVCKSLHGEYITALETKKHSSRGLDAVGASKASHRGVGTALATSTPHGELS